MTVITQLNRLRTEQWCLCQLERAYETFHQTGELLFNRIHSFKSKRGLNFNFLQYLTVNEMK
ncbi:hypothetical protein D3C73_584300 [compost metagenome]